MVIANHIALHDTNKAPLIGSVICSHGETFLRLNNSRYWVLELVMSLLLVDASKQLVHHVRAQPKLSLRVEPTFLMLMGFILFLCEN